MKLGLGLGLWSGIKKRRAISYLLRTLFSAVSGQPVTMTDGQVLYSIADGIYDGSLRAVIKDGGLSINNDSIEVVGQSTTTDGDLVLVSQEISRESGVSLFGTYKQTSISKIGGYGYVNGVSAKFGANGNRENCYFCVSSKLRAYGNGLNDYAEIQATPTTDIDFLIVLRPVGAWFFTKSPASTDYTLVWVDHQGNSGTLYAALASWDMSGSLSNPTAYRLQGGWRHAYGLATDRKYNPSANDTLSHESDFVCDMRICSLPSSGSIDLRFRQQDATNYWQVVIDSAGEVNLNEVADGVPTSRGLYSGASSGDIIRIFSYSATIEVWKNYTKLISYASASAYQAETTALVAGLGVDGILENIVFWPRTTGLSLPSVTDGAQLETPVGFSKNPSFSIYRGTVKNFTTNFDVTEFRNTSGKAYYVATDGSDSNDGLSSLSPLRKIRTALAKPDIDVLYISAGVYDVDTGWLGTTVSRDLSVICEVGTVIGCHRTVTWTQNVTYQDVYECLSANTLRVFDAGNLDSDGKYGRLVAQTSVADVDANPGSFYVDGTTVYVRTVDSREPDSSVRVAVQATNGKYDYDGSLYIENARFEFGYQAFHLVSSGGAGTQRAYFNSCSFDYATGDESTGGNGLTVESDGEVYSVGCMAYKNRRDGFNYDMATGGQALELAVEIGCTGRNNGFVASGEANNGSTMHNGGRVIRINGEYSNNQGRNIHDIDYPVQSWNIGCSACGSRTDTSQYNVDYAIGHPSNGDGGSMWIDTCVCGESDYSFRVNNSAVMYVRTTDTSGDKIVTGKLMNY